MTADPRLMVAKRLLTEYRWAALATCRDNVPFASMVAYVCVPKCTALIMVLSDLAVHTQMIRQNPSVALVVSEPERPEMDLQDLPRVTVIGEMRFVDPLEADYTPWRQQYLARLPEAKRLFELRDFHVVALIPASLRVVAGVGQIASVPVAALRDAWD